MGKKKQFLTDTGLTEAEFEDKKTTLEGKLQKKLDEMKGRKISLEKALEKCPLLSKEVIAGSMKVQKDIQEKMGKLKGLIDQRQKVLVAKVKQMEEEKLCEIQNASSELRAARGKIVDRMNTTNALLYDTDVYELFERADEEEKQLDACLAEQVGMTIKTNTAYDCELETEAIHDMLASTLQFKRDEAVEEDPKASEAEGKAKQVIALREQIRSLEKEKKICVASEDFLEAAQIKTKIDELVTELEELAESMPSVEDDREARKKKKDQEELSENFRNWDAVKYKNTVGQGKQSEAGLLNFLF